LDRESITRIRKSSGDKFAGDAKRIYEAAMAREIVAEIRRGAVLIAACKNKRLVVRVLKHSISMPNYDAVLTLLQFQLKDVGDEDDPPNVEDLDPEDFTVKRKRWRARAMERHGLHNTSNKL
jgi:hypothetical protein